MLSCTLEIIWMILAVQIQIAFWATPEIWKPICQPPPLPTLRQCCWAIMSFKLSYSIFKFLILKFQVSHQEPIINTEKFKKYESLAKFAWFDSI
jgi:hypothetical protein